MVSVLYCYQFQHGIKITKKTRIFRYAFEFGAVDGSRTRYLQLGRLPLYQMSYYRRLRPFRNLCGGGWTRTADRLITNQLLYQLSYIGLGLRLSFK